jgi:putative ABC transport system substrate-binding protein
VSNTPVILATAQATRTTPIVTCLPHRPLLELGLVDSLAHPGRNVTGSETSDDIYAKSVELLAQVVPWMTRIGTLHNPETAGTVALMSVVRSAADRLGLEPIEVHARTLDDLEAAFAGLAAAGAQGVFVATDSALTTGGSGSPADPLFVLPMRHRLPTIYSQISAFVPNGGLMGFAASISASYVAGARYVDKILKGATVDQLPVERATTFEFAVNVTTARSLGLTIPPDVAAQVTEWVP